MKGILTKRRYTAATVFVYHFSGYSYLCLQTDLSSVETVEAKECFEAFSKTHRVHIQHYHTDNGRFADNLFLQHVHKCGQTISHCAAHAHHQNGRAEKKIRDVQELGRKQLLHAMTRWPEAITYHLWPYALRNENYIINYLPQNENGVSPIEHFFSTSIQARLKEFHAFGCPVYALHPSLQGTMKIPKWQPRFRISVYLGVSPRHARNVSMILSITTGLVSPQFHVTHDEFFETVKPISGNPPTTSMWQQLSGITRSPRRLLRSEGESEQPIGLIHPPIEKFISAPTSNTDVENKSVTPSLRRSTRKSKPTDILTYQSHHFDDEERYYDVLHQEDYQIQNQMDDPICFMASNHKDTMYFHEAMRAPDRHQFIQAMVQEINSHVKKKHWKLIPINEVPPSTKILDSVWAMKRKCDIVSQKVYKWKARLNVHGGQQQFGVNYYKTYSPVVMWTSIRLFLTLAIIKSWKTRQIDFTLAYPQEDI